MTLGLCSRTKMPRLIHLLSDASSSSFDDRIVPLDSSDNKGLTKARIEGVGSKNTEAESSHMGEINDSQIGLCENGKSNELKEEITDIDGVIVNIIILQANTLSLKYQC